jgi:hypothetical protein
VALPPDAAALLADAVLYLHAGFVLFVVAGQAFILLGWRRGWDAARNRGFRWSHLAAIAYVAVGSWLDLSCPLTLWENRLRALAAQEGYRRGFIADRVSELIFYEAPDWAFVLLYSLFGALTLFSFVRYPPARRASRRRGW